MTETDTDTLTPQLDALIDMCALLPREYSYSVGMCLKDVRHALQQTAPHGDPSFYEDVARKVRVQVLHAVMKGVLEMQTALITQEGQQ